MIRQGRLAPFTRDSLLVAAMAAISTSVALIPFEAYSEWETKARKRIPMDPTDWPTVALALALDAGIWTNDSDFLGCGCPTWTTRTLAIELGL